MSEHDARTIDLRALIKAVWRRKWFLIVPVLAGGITGFVVAKSLAPIYESRSTIIVRSSGRLSEPLAQMIGRSPLEEQLGWLQEKVKSRSFLVELVRTLGLADEATMVAWAQEAHASDPSFTAAEHAENRAVEGLQRRVSVARTSADAFQVIARDHDPGRAMLLAQHITNAFVSASDREQLEGIRKVHDFSIEQLVIYRQKLDEAEHELKEYEQTRVTSRGTVLPVESANLDRVDVLISQATVDRTAATQQLADSRGILRSAAGASFDVLIAAEAEAFTSNRDELVSLEGEIGSVLIRAAPDGPEITSISVTIAENKRGMRAEARRLALATVPGASADLVDAYSQYKTAEVELAMVEQRKRVLERTMWSYTQGQATAAGDELELTRLRQRVEGTRALYETFLQQNAGAQITEALEAARAGGRFEIIEPPIRPTSPVAPDKPMILLLSVFGGLVVGMGLILATEQSDTSFKDIDMIQKVLGLPVLATVPNADVFREVLAEEKRSRRRGTEQIDGDSVLLRDMVRENPVSFEFRRLARKLSKAHGDAPPRTILVTSSNRGEGKTTVAACLAITLAKHYGHRTVIVDCDLRKPRIHKLLAVSSRPGLTDALERGNLLGTDIKPTPLPELFVLPCGTRREQPTWLLESFPDSRVMEELLASFDHVILDTAPNLPVPDAVLLGGRVDTVVMVLKAGVTPREVAQRGVELQLEEKENVLGLVINNLERVLPYYYDYRYYGSMSSDKEGRGESPQ